MKHMTLRPSVGSLIVLVATCVIAAGGSVAASQHLPLEVLRTRDVTIAVAQTAPKHADLDSNGPIRSVLRCSIIDGGGYTEATILIRTTGQGAWVSGPWANTSPAKVGAAFLRVAQADAQDGFGGAMARNAYDVLLADGTIQHYVVDVGASVRGVACWARLEVLSN